jgi:hypothetical protein
MSFLRLGRGADPGIDRFEGNAGDPKNRDLVIRHPVQGHAWANVLGRDLSQLFEQPWNICVQSHEPSLQTK